MVTYAYNLSHYTTFQAIGPKISGLTQDLRPKDLRNPFRGGNDLDKKEDILLFHMDPLETQEPLREVGSPILTTRRVTTTRTQTEIETVNVRPSTESRSQESILLPSLVSRTESPYNTLTCLYVCIVSRATGRRCVVSHVQTTKQTEVTLLVTAVK